MKFYADAPVRRTRQMIADAVCVVWCLIAIWLGMFVHDKALIARDGARQLQSGSTSLSGALKDAGGAASHIPFVGGEVRAPFDRAAKTGAQLAASGENLATGLGRFAILLGILVAAVPIAIAAIGWWMTRLRFARAAGRLHQLRSMPGGDRLLALEAFTLAPPRTLAALHGDPVQAWVDNDPRVTRELAAMVLGTYGLRGGFDRDRGNSNELI